MGRAFLRKSVTQMNRYADFLMRHSFVLPLRISFGTGRLEIPPAARIIPRIAPRSHGELPAKPSCPYRWRQIAVSLIDPVVRVPALFSCPLPSDHAHDIPILKQVKAGCAKLVPAGWHGSGKAGIVPFCIISFMERAEHNPIPHASFAFAAQAAQSEHC
jgi:hypothetical protein